MAVGEYTPGGRFMVQQQFERPIFFAALQFSFEQFAARRTDTGTRDTTEREYTYRPNSAAGEPTLGAVDRSTDSAG